MRNGNAPHPLNLDISLSHDYLLIRVIGVNAPISHEAFIANQSRHLGNLHQFHSPAAAPKLTRLESSVADSNAPLFVQNLATVGGLAPDNQSDLKAHDVLYANLSRVDETEYKLIGSGVGGWVREFGSAVS